MSSFQFSVVRGTPETLTWHRCVDATNHHSDYHRLTSKGFDKDLHGRGARIDGKSRSALTFKVWRTENYDRIPLCCVVLFCETVSERAGWFVSAMFTAINANASS